MSTCRRLTVSTSDGARLACRVWIPPGSPTLAVHIVHGLSEHGGRYDHVAERLAAEGWLVTAHDQRGHGLSSGLRGHARYEQLLDDLALVTDGRSLPMPPGIRQRFLLGQSLGGNVVLNYVLRRKPAVSGLVVLSPLLKPTVRPPKWKVQAGQLLCRVAPWYRFQSRIDVVHSLSHDPEVGQRLLADPLHHGQVSAGLALEMFRAGHFAWRHAEELSIPTLLMHGDADPLTSCEASLRFAAKAGPICTMRAWPGAYHELHNEIQRQQVLDEIAAWIHTTAAGGP